MVVKISSKSIKKKAQELGFQKVGIAKAVETSKENKVDTYISGKAKYGYIYIQ